MRGSDGACNTLVSTFQSEMDGFAMVVPGVHSGGAGTYIPNSQGYVSGGRSISMYIWISR